jgi:ATP synthase F1 complex assembly factor 1
LIHVCPLCATYKQPLAEIINLPLLHMTPHDRDAIAKIWTGYHTSHPTLSSGFLSAFLSQDVYAKMVETAKANPFFVLPLPRPATSDSEVGEVLTDSYEMFYLQWLFHPTSDAALPPPADGTTKPLPHTSSVIFTPLEEFKRSGEWAQPYLVLTHYPEMAHSHDLVLMRGEITSASAGGPAGSDANPGFMLSQQQAQLLALALQKFYCTSVELPNEDARGKKERLDRAETLKAFRERPQDWDWEGLVEMAYGGIV